MIKEQELETIKHRIADDESAILDPTIPALRDGFHSRIRTVGQLIQKLKPVLMEVRGSGAGPFLRGMLEKLDSELYKTLQAACVIPEEILTKATTTVAGAKKRVQHDLLQALEINEKTIKEYLTPIWNSIEALALLSTVDFAALVPGEGGKGLQVPMRPVKDQLIQLACAMDVCSRNNRPGAIKGATEYVSLRTGKTEYRGRDDLAGN